MGYKWNLRDSLPDPSLYALISMHGYVIKKMAGPSKKGKSALCIPGLGLTKRQPIRYTDGSKQVHDDGANMLRGGVDIVKMGNFSLYHSKGFWCHKHHHLR